jgi:hypothetical protein
MKVQMDVEVGLASGLVTPRPPTTLYKVVLSKGEILW